MRTFYQVAINALLVTLANFFLWFALVFWVYLETKSVLASSIIAGAYMVIATLSGFWFGGIVDHHKRKSAMLFRAFLRSFSLLWPARSIFLRHRMLLPVPAASGSGFS